MIGFIAAAEDGINRPYSGGRYSGDVEGRVVASQRAV
jgi:hypothetical protein